MITYEIYTRYRNERHLKDGEVARLAGIPPSTFSDWKNGKSTPKQDKMSKIALALGMDYYEFVGPVGKFSALNPKKAKVIDPGPVIPQHIMDTAIRLSKLSPMSQAAIMDYIDYYEQKEKKQNPQ